MCSCGCAHYTLSSHSLLQAPNQERRSTLRSLFPSSSRQPFQPLSNVEEPPSKKKRLSLERRKRITVVLLPAAHTSVPRGATRIQLNEQGRVQENFVFGLLVIDN